MEVIIFVIIAGAIAWLLYGIYLTIIEETIPFMAEIIQMLWPFILGSLIGIPLSLTEKTKIIGNVFVALGIIGNVVYKKRGRFYF